MKLTIVLALLVACASAEWFVGMKAHKNISPSGIALWEANAALNPDDSTLQNYATNTKNYVSRQAAYWPSNLICEVRYSMFTAGVEMKYVTFNSQGRGKNGWFHVDRVLSSSFTDLDGSEPINFFTLHTDHDRSFFIESNYGGCSVDAGWMAASTHNVCSWEQRANPGYFYATGSVKERNDLNGVADVMIISFRTLTPVSFSSNFPDTDIFGFNRLTTENTGDGHIHGIFGGGESLSRTYLLQTPHSKVRFKFRYFAIDSWDGSEYGWFKVDGTQIATFARPGACGGSRPSFQFPNPYSSDTSNDVCYYDAQHDVAHTAGSVTVEFGSTIGQDKSDESWAMNRFEMYTFVCEWGDH